MADWRAKKREWEECKKQNAEIDKKVGRLNEVEKKIDIEKTKMGLQKDLMTQMMRNIEWKGSTRSTFEFEYYNQLFNEIKKEDGFWGGGIIDTAEDRLVQCEYDLKKQKYKDDFLGTLCKLWQDLKAEAEKLANNIN